MRPILVLPLLATACAPGGGGLLARLNGRVTASIAGLPLAQAPVVSGESGAPEAPSEGEAVIGLDACDAAAPLLGRRGRATFATPLLMWGETSEVARPVTVVRVEDGACSVLATLDDEETRLFHGGLVGAPHGDECFFAAKGVVMPLVETDGGLLLFSSRARGGWHIDPNTGVVTRTSAPDGFVTGAASDGFGGALVVTSPEQRADESGPQHNARLWSLDADGGLVGAAEALPIPYRSTGMGGGDDRGAASAFVNNPIAILPNGDRWVLDGTGAKLISLDGHPEIVLEGHFPSGLAVWGGDLLVTTGAVHTMDLDDEAAIPAVVSEPKLLRVDPGSGAQSEIASFAAPAGHTWLDAGGMNSGDYGGDGNAVAMDVHFPLTVDPEGVVVGDPSFGRALFVD